MSGDVLKALWDHPDAVVALCQHFTTLITNGDVAASYHDAYVCLIPKLQMVTTAKDVRPINLIEAMHKVYTSLLVNASEHNGIFLSTSLVASKDASHLMPCFLPNAAWTKKAL